MTLKEVVHRTDTIVATQMVFRLSNTNRLSRRKPRFDGRDTFNFSDGIFINVFGANRYTI